MRNSQIEKLTVKNHCSGKIGSFKDVNKLDGSERKEYLYVKVFPLKSVFFTYGRQLYRFIILHRTKHHIIVNVTFKKFTDAVSTELVIEFMKKSNVCIKIDLTETD